MMPSNGLLVVAKVLPGREKFLAETLNRIGNDIRGRRRAADKSEPHIDFPASRTLHFARLALFADPDSGPERKRLLLVTDYEGSWDAHVKELATLATDADAIWGCCEGYSGPENFAPFIRARMVEPQAYYIALPEVTLEQIRSLLQLRLKFDTKLIGPPATSLVTEFLKLGMDAGRLAFAGLDVLGMLWKHGPVNTLLAARQVNASLDRIWYIWLFNRLTFNSMPPPKVRYSQVVVDNAAVPATTLATDETVPLEAWEGTPPEDLVSQNQLTLVTVVQAEKLKRLQAVLAVIDLFGKRLAAPGSLAGITRIHTVRWALIDGGKRLLFASNYDGTWENYIDEFAELILSGLDAIWESSHGFPENGAQDVEALKEFLRFHQAPANAFYSASPDVTLLNIVDALQIEQSLESAAEKVSESAPRRATERAPQPAPEPEPIHMTAAA